MNLDDYYSKFLDKYESNPRQSQDLNTSNDNLNPNRYTNVKASMDSANKRAGRMLTLSKAGKNIAS